MQVVTLPRPRVRRVAGYLASALLLGLLAVPSPTPATAGPTPPSTLTATTNAPRMAFTDDGDKLVGLPAGASPAADIATGREPSTNDQGDVAFVDTLATPTGDIYLKPAGLRTIRLTCGDHDVETHPVPSPDGTKVAFASNHDGRFHIWVAWLGGPAVPGTDCPAIRTTQVTSGAGTDLWPSWVGEDGIVFSSTRDDPLGDIEETAVGTSTSPPAATDRTKVTKSPAAETQPFAFYDGDVDTSVVFTTTAYRADGSLASTNGSSSGWQPVRSLWGNGTPRQSSEAVMSVPEATGYLDHIAFTSTDFDPYGDIVVAQIGSPFDPVIGTRVSAPSSSVPGRAESHPAFLTSTDPTQIAYTARAGAASVSDALSTTGADRRVVASSSSTTPDQATTAYSPDGTRLVWSRSTGTTGSEHQLVVGSADGTAVTVLNDDHQLGDVDTEPSWSADGTRVAFVRFAVGEGGLVGRVWIADLMTGATRQLTTDTTTLNWDEGPSWSPDGRSIVVSRSALPLTPLLVATVTPASKTLPIDDQEAVTATLTNLSARRASAPHVLIHTLTLPSPLTLSSTDPSCVRVDAGLDCSVSSLGPGESVTWTVDTLGATVGTGTIEISQPAGSPYPLAPSTAEIVVLPSGCSSFCLQQSTVSPSTVRAAPTRPPDGYPSTIWVLDASSGAGVQLDEIPATVVGGTGRPAVPLEGRSPAWSPRGLDIAYERRGAIAIASLRPSPIVGVPKTPAEVAAVRFVTGFTDTIAQPVDPQQPTPSRASISAAHDPAWSPDGTQIAFSGQPAGQGDQSGIYAIHADGSSLRVVTDGRGPETEPAWQPWADVGVTLLAQPATIPVGLPAKLAATVRNAGPAPATGIVLRVDRPAGLTLGSLPAGCSATQAGASCVAGDLAVGQSAVWTFVGTSTLPGSAVVSAAASLTSPDPNPADNVTAATLLLTPGQSSPPAGQGDLTVRLSVDRNPGYVGGSGLLTAVVTNRGSRLSLGATLQLAYPGAIVVGGGASSCVSGETLCDLGTIEPGTSRQVKASLVFLSAGTGNIVATARSTSSDPTPSDNEGRVALRVLQPQLTVSPGVVSPGEVVVASGTDFPPGASVSLAWDHGITARRAGVVVSTDGRLPETPMLVFRRDALGTRHLVATATAAGLFGPVDVDVLVVPSTVDPPFAERGSG